MSRYITRAYRPLFVETPLWEPPRGGAPDLSVDGAKEVDTGLVTERGEPIMRCRTLSVSGGRMNDDRRLPKSPERRSQRGRIVPAFLCAG